MTEPKPLVNATQAERWAQQIFGISSEAVELPGYSDRNYRLQTGDGSRYVLKIAFADSGRQVIDSQIEALRLLAATDLSQIVPRVVHDVEGRTLVPMLDQGRAPVIARVLTYLSGKPMAQVDLKTGELRRQVGRALGLLDRELESFNHPGAHRRTPWDLARTAELRPLLDLLENDLRPLVEAGLEGFETRVRPRLGDLRRSVIHNDANDYNLLVRLSSDGTQELSGLIDFGDMLETMTVAELAIASAYAMLDEDDPENAAKQVRTGYEEALPLADIERDLLPDLIVARLCGSLLLSAQASQRDPDNEYIQVSRRPVADLLRKLS